MERFSTFCTQGVATVAPGCYRKGMDITQNPSPEEAPMIRTTDPTGPGALAGFATTCPVCGMELKSSMPTLLAADAERHAEWHRKTLAERNPFDTLRENPFEESAR
jgi:hypothetical protein